AVGTVRHLMLGAAGPQSGFERLVKAKHLDWTVEWLVSNDPKWRPLFQRSEWAIRIAQARRQSAPNPKLTRFPILRCTRFFFCGDHLITCDGKSGPIIVGIVSARYHGLKIPFRATGVRVQVPPRAPNAFRSPSRG